MSRLLACPKLREWQHPKTDGAEVLPSEINCIVLGVSFSDEMSQPLTCILFLAISSCSGVPYRRRRTLPLCGQHADCI